jgi:hypothetical protein
MTGIPTSYLYNNTIGDFLKGLNTEANTYIVNLYAGAAFVFNGTHATKAAVDAANTQLATGNGYTQDTKALTSVSVVVSGNDAAFTAGNPEWEASGGAIGPVRGAVVFNSSRSGSPPVVAVDFGGQKTADNGAPLRIIWAAGKIVDVQATDPA